MTTEPRPAPVEFVINCFERNIGLVTEPGFLNRASSQHGHSFAVRTLLINNVGDREDARRKAAGAIARGEIDRYAFVDEHLNSALRRTNLKRRDFGRYLHWSDCCLVALNLDGPDLLCYVDVDLDLRGGEDWIQRGLDLFAEDPRVGVANPNWRMADGSTTVEREADEIGPGWFKGYGFTDQIFLCSRSQFAKPLLRRWVPLALASPASARWAGYQLPIGESTLFFEQIMDAYMRRRRILRVTIASREFEPIPMTAYPARGIAERIAGRVSREWLRLIAASRRWNPQLIASPRLRTTGILDPDYR
ncbi:hypothetical protein BH10ACT5_BH10ACT5_18950 [soil metagenome]